MGSYNPGRRGGPDAESPEQPAPIDALLDATAEDAPVLHLPVAPTPQADPAGEEVTDPVPDATVDPGGAESDGSESQNVDAVSEADVAGIRVDAGGVPPALPPDAGHRRLFALATLGALGLAGAAAWAAVRRRPGSQP